MALLSLKCSRRAAARRRGLTVVALALLLLPPPLATAAAAPPLGSEASVVHDLLLLLLRAAPKWASSAGWAPSSKHHCSWQYITCNPAGHVTGLELNARLPLLQGSTGDARAVDLPTELLQLSKLRHLQNLQLGWTAAGRPLSSAIPQEWLLPGAFPCLKRLCLQLPRVSHAASLPEIPAGAFTSLETLELQFDNLHSSLPASWGASPHVLPALRQLSLTLQVEGGLPAAWSHGFPQLRGLSVIHVGPPQPRQQDGSPEGVALAGLGEAPSSRLPASWGAGGFRQLDLLALERLWVHGPLPEQWLSKAGSFPALTRLRLTALELTGPLPPHLFERLPSLRHVQLNENQFTGALPDAWGHSKVESLQLSNNALSGPAFPPAWLEPGTLPNLTHLRLTYNPGLTGSLPATPPWPLLQSMVVLGTGLTGSIPAGWCEAPFAGTLRSLDLYYTSVEPSLPECAARCLPLLRVDTELAAPGLEPPPAPRIDGRQGRGQAPKGVKLTGALLLCILVTAGFVGGRMWQRRLRQLRQHLQEQQEQQGLLVQHSGSCRMAASEGVESLGKQGARPAAPASLAQQAQHRRLAALLSATGRQAAREQGTCGAVLLRRPLWCPAQQQQLPAESGTLHTQQWRAGSKLDAASAAAAHISPRGPPISWKWPVEHDWRLPTQSLRISASSLQFVVGSNGQVVELGMGGHALVVLAKLQPGDWSVAVKAFELEAGVDSGAMWQEVEMMQRCEHPRVAHIVGVALQGRLFMVAMELMHHGSVQSVLGDPQRRDELRWEARGRQVAVDVAEALDHLHTKLGVMHGDLKPGNVLLSADWRACLADLGMAQLLGTGARTAAGCTYAYAAPEQLMGQRCILSADMYSLGLLLVVLLTQRLASSRQGWHLPRVSEQCPQEVVALIEECLLVDPQQRPSAAEAWARLRAAS